MWLLIGDASTVMLGVVKVGLACESVEAELNYMMRILTVRQCWHVATDVICQQNVPRQVLI